VANVGYAVALHHYVDAEIVASLKLPADYYVFPIVDKQRDLRPQAWHEAWEKLKNDQPVMVVKYDGITYTYVYAGESQPTNHSTFTIERGGNTLIFIAWFWMFALLAGVIWSVHQQAAQVSYTGEIYSPAG